MKKLLISSIVALSTATCFASDSLPQEVTSEVFTSTEQVTVTNESYQPRIVNRRPYRSTYCGYADDRGYCNRNVIPRPYKLQPVTVYTGKTVTVQKHYDVYQPKVVYEKVNSYTTTQTCEYCE